MEVPVSSGDREAERLARKMEQQRKRRQAERESTDPEVVAKRRARAERDRLKGVARRVEQQRKRRQAELESTDPEVVAKRQARAERDRLETRARRARETPEQRARRLEAMRVRQATRRSLETLEEREARLAAHRIVLRQYRKRKAARKGAKNDEHRERKQTKDTHKQGESPASGPPQDVACPSSSGSGRSSESFSTSKDCESTFAPVWRRGGPRKTEAEKAETKARNAEALRQRRATDPEYRARSAEATRREPGQESRELCEGGRGQAPEAP
ncbi:hypothetical protein MTO96_026556 [Rhipicephalus appendiculatus]